MSIQKGISRIGNYISIILGVLFGGFIFLLTFSTSLYKAVFYGLLSFAILWVIVKLLTVGIIWIVNGFKEK